MLGCSEQWSDCSEHSDRSFRSRQVGPVKWTGTTRLQTVCPPSWAYATGPDGPRPAVTSGEHGPDSGEGEEGIAGPSNFGQAPVGGGTALDRHSSGGDSSGQALAVHVWTGTRPSNVGQALDRVGQLWTGTRRPPLDRHPAVERWTGTRPGHSSGALARGLVRGWIGRVAADRSSHGLGASSRRLGGFGEVERLRAVGGGFGPDAGGASHESGCRRQRQELWQLNRAEIVGETLSPTLRVHPKDRRAGRGRRRRGR